MSRSAIREAEHRRGMVLGFTLAEVLLLLLFLLLLAQGAQLVKLRDALESSPDQDKAELHKLQRDFRAMTPLLRQAEKLNPDDPPQALKAGLTFVEKFGIEAQAEQLRPVSPQTIQLLERASRLGDGPPEKLLQRGLAALEKVGLDTPIAEIHRVPPDVTAAINRASKIDSNSPGSALQVALDKAEKPGPLSNGKHDWPPIISLSEADGYFFESGSTEPSSAFREVLSKTVVDRLLEIIKRHDVNVIEVVGHTDEQPLSGRPSNLDKHLFSYLNGQPTEKFSPSDNAGLGLARAVAVLKLLRDDARLRRQKDLRIIPLSGAQLTTTSDQLATGGAQAVTKRRRIEIRLRRSDREAVAELPDSEPIFSPQTPAEEKPRPASRPSDPDPITAPAQYNDSRPSSAPRIATKPREGSCAAIDRFDGRC
jgi:flagellar motor protein MotB